MSAPASTSTPPRRKDMTRPPTWGSTSKYTSSNSSVRFTSYLALDDDARPRRRVGPEVSLDRLAVHHELRCAFSTPDVLHVHQVLGPPAFAGDRERGDLF